MPRIARLLRFWPKRPAIAECRCATLADAGLVSVPARDRNQGSGLSGRDHERVELAAGLAAGELCISRRRPQHRPASMLARYPPIARTLPHPAGPAVARRRLRAAAACTRRYEEPNARLGATAARRGEAVAAPCVAICEANLREEPRPFFGVLQLFRREARAASSGTPTVGAAPFALRMARLPAAALRGLRKVAQRTL